MCYTRHVAKLPWRSVVSIRLASLIAATATAGAIAAAAPAAASAAILRVPGCEVIKHKEPLAMRGFAPDSRFLIYDGTHALNSGALSTGPTGSFDGNFTPGLRAGVIQRSSVLSVLDSRGNLARARFTVTHRTGAQLAPSRGNPRTLRVRFYVWAFALDGRNREIYVHYVAPGGRFRRTYALGHSGGQCGYLRTGLRHIFPFRAGLGTWRLQIDTQRRFSHHPHGSRVDMKVRIRRA